MTCENEDDLAALRRIGQLVARCLRHMAAQMEPGMTTTELDGIGGRYLEQRGARSAPRLCYDFPGATCISVNEEVAHGIPGERVLRRGDLVNIDVSAELDGYFADTGGSYAIAPVASDHEALLRATRQALTDALDAARATRRLNGIGRAIERRAHRAGLRVIRNIGSHGVGRHLHEEPSFIPGYYDRSDRRVLREGDVITIEPFLSTGGEMVVEAEDGWTLLNPAGGRCAQYEHTLVITRSKPLVMTLAD
jgi:methionyl aminopeptidase